MLKLSWWLVALQLSSSYYHVCTLIKASCSQLPRALTAQHSSTTTIWNKILQASSDTGFAKIMLHVEPLHNWNTKNRSNFSGSTQSLSVASIRGRRQPQHHEITGIDLQICVHHRPWGPEFRIHEISFDILKFTHFMFYSTYAMVYWCTIFDLRLFFYKCSKSSSKMSTSCNIPKYPLMLWFSQIAFPRDRCVHGKMIWKHAASLLRNNFVSPCGRSVSTVSGCPQCTLAASSEIIWEAMLQPLSNCEKWIEATQNVTQEKVIWEKKWLKWSLAKLLAKFL